MGNENSSLRPTVFFYIVAVGCMCTLWIMFMHAIGCGAHWLPGDILRCAGEMVFLSSPYWFVGRKWRIVLALLPLLMAVAIIPDILYFRFWGDILGVSAFFMSGNVNGDLVESGMSLLQWQDVWYAVFGMLPLSLYFLLPPLSYRFERSTRLWLICGSLFLILFCGYVNVRGVVKNSSSTHTGQLSYRQAAATLWQYEQLNQWKSLSRGLIWHSLNIIRDIRSLHHARISLSDDERKDIARFIAEVPGETPDSLLKSNRNRNVVMIVVESLNSSVVDTRVNGVEVTPVLDSLCRSGRGVVCRKVVSQIKSGGSSDGQILLNTGMLPPILGAAALMYPDVLPYLPSLPGFLSGHEAMCVFATDGKWWSERGVQRSLGYTSTYVLGDYPSQADSLGRDGGMFAFALDIFRTRLNSAKENRPILLQLISGSMHIPFRDEGAPEIREFSELSEELRDYYTVTRYFDTSLGLFLNGLKELGIADDTIVIIASDHSESVAEECDRENYAFYGVFGSGTSADINRVVGQVNLFPTTLYVLGINPAGQWHGLGPSVFDPFLDSALTPLGRSVGETTPFQQEAYAIADLIWRGNYFHLADSNR